LTTLYSYSEFRKIEKRNLNSSIGKGVPREKYPKKKGGEKGVELEVKKKNWERRTISLLKMAKFWKSGGHEKLFLKRFSNDFPGALFHPEA